MNLITAAEFSQFLLNHFDAFPDLPRNLYSRSSFTYPDERHMAGTAPGVSITQNNRNLLVGTYPGADGVKTGFIDESGYHLAATSMRDGRRLVAVVLGVDAASHAEGGQIRAADAAALLDYGFESFETLSFEVPDLNQIEVFKGRSRRVNPIAPLRLSVTVPVGMRSSLSGRVEQVEHVIAPLPRGAVIGSVRVELDGLVLAEASITTPHIETGGFLRRMWDSVRLFFRRVRGRSEPTTFP
jgi:D-alanyl-D-alanine carboxypeptidase (penicillin-binding protein 5/6)